MQDPARIVRVVLEVFSETLKANDWEELKRICSPAVKLSEGMQRILGPPDFASFFRKANSEFTAESFSFLVTDDCHLIVNGFCVWRNARHVFSLVLRWEEPDPTSNTPQLLSVLSLILSSVK
jgi:hypothetical protein